MDTTRRSMKLNMIAKVVVSSTFVHHHIGLKLTISIERYCSRLLSVL